MSHKKLPQVREENQTAITDFTKSKHIEEIQEKVKLLKLTVRKQERVKPGTFSYSPSAIKRKTPPSLEKEELAKKLHFEESPNTSMQTP